MEVALWHNEFNEFKESFPARKLQKHHTSRSWSTPLLHLSLTKTKPLISYILLSISTIRIAGKPRNTVYFKYKRNLNKSIP